MKSTEFRIGNLIMLSGSYDMVAIASIARVWMQYRFFQKVMRRRLVSDIIPIPLTEELLLKCEGMERKEHGFRIKNIIIETLFDEWDIRMFIRDENSLFIKTIESLHEFQDFYFTIYKTELQINL